MGFSPEGWELGLYTHLYTHGVPSGIRAVYPLYTLVATWCCITLYTAVYPAQMLACIPTCIPPCIPTCHSVYPPVYHINDDRAVVLVRFYREASANADLLPIERDNQPRTKMYHLSLTNGGYRFEWMRAKSALCNVQLTKLQRSDPKYARMYRINAQDEQTMLHALKTDPETN